MKIFRVFINGKPYLGEDPEKTYLTGEHFSRNSFHTTKFYANILMIGTGGEEPKAVCGIRSLKSDLEKIILRIEDGLIDVKEIRIVVD